MQFGGIHDNTILYYFAASPFFDPTSNNAVVFSQAVRNQSQLHIIATRQAFEARLREMSGLEYIVAQEPAETGPGMGTGVWVIRKQTRRKVKGSNGFPAPDEIEVHSDYFVVGENIYMAPSLANILSSRIVSLGLHFPRPCSIHIYVPIPPLVAYKLTPTGLDCFIHYQDIPHCRFDKKVVTGPGPWLQNPSDEFPNFSATGNRSRIQGGHADA